MWNIITFKLLLGLIVLTIFFICWYIDEKRMKED